MRAARGDLRGKKPRGSRRGSPLSSRTRKKRGKRLEKPRHLHGPAKYARPASEKVKVRHCVRRKVKENPANCPCHPRASSADGGNRLRHFWTVSELYAKQIVALLVLSTVLGLRDCWSLLQLYIERVATLYVERIVTFLVFITVLGNF